jgi:ubiquinone/menaquinone biosynthesis C-methylase UbiE
VKDSGSLLARRPEADGEAPAARLFLQGEPVAGMRALDVGCGDGRMVRRLRAAGAWATGVDVRSDAGGVRGDAHRLPFRGGVFDRVSCCLVLHYLDHPGEAIAEMARVLRPGGRLLFADRVSSSPPERRAAQDRIEWLRNPALRALRSPEEILAMLYSAGFRVTQAEEMTWSRSFEDWMEGVDEVRAAAQRAVLDPRGVIDLGGTWISSGEVRLRVALFTAERR